ncbi:hypothetical protein PCE1_004397 [Barthelona sp. PCE]
MPAGIISKSHDLKSPRVNRQRKSPEKVQATSPQAEESMEQENTLLSVRQFVSPFEPPKKEEKRVPSNSSLITEHVLKAKDPSTLRIQNDPISIVISTSRSSTSVSLEEFFMLNQEEDIEMATSLPTEFRHLLEKSNSSKDVARGEAMVYYYINDEEKLKGKLKKYRSFAKREKREDVSSLLGLVPLSSRRPSTHRKPVLRKTKPMKQKKKKSNFSPSLDNFISGRSLSAPQKKTPLKKMPPKKKLSVPSLKLSKVPVKEQRALTERLARREKRNVSYGALKRSHMSHSLRREMESITKKEKKNLTSIERKKIQYPFQKNLKTSIKDVRVDSRMSNIALEDDELAEYAGIL